MARGRPKGSKNRTSGENLDRRTPVKLTPIPRVKDDGNVHEAWKIMEEYVAVRECFAHLRDATIRLYWTKDWRPDADGVVVGAQVSKASERERLDAEQHNEPIPDAQIILPKDQWPMLSDVEKRHRVFHELLHIAFAKTGTGSVKMTTHNWRVVRLRRHPIAAFPEEVEEFGVEAVLGRNGQIQKALEYTERPMEKTFDEAEAEMNGDGTAEQPIAGEATTISTVPATIGKEVETPEVAAGNGELTSQQKATKLAKVLSSPRHIDLLADSDEQITTVGRLQALFTKYGDTWHKGLKGIGDKAAEKIADEFNEWIMAAAKENEAATAR